MPGSTTRCMASWGFCPGGIYYKFHQCRRKLSHDGPCRCYRCGFVRIRGDETRA